MSLKSPGRKPVAQVAKAPEDISSIHNTAADIISDSAAAGVAVDAELPPPPGIVQGYAQEGSVPDSGAATNAAVNAELPPQAGAQAPSPSSVEPSSSATAPLNIPADVTRVGEAPLPTDSSGKPITADATGTPFNRKAKYTDKSVYVVGVQADVRNAVMRGQLVRRVTNDDGAPVYRFYS